MAAESTSERYNRVMVNNSQNASEPSSQVDESRPSFSWLPWVIGLILLGIVVFFAIRALFFSPANEPAVNQPAANQPAANQPAANQPAANQPATLESPDSRSATSNVNFVGYYGSRGEGWIVPQKVLDTFGVEREVGSILFTWCETSTECYYEVLLPGDKIDEGHQGSQVNIYAPAYKGHESDELQYIQTNQKTTWTLAK